MADWTKPFSAAYTWWRVPRASYAGDLHDAFYSTGTETEQVTNITGGTLQMNGSTETFETGTVRCVGPLDVGTDLVRCHMTATWDDGTSEDVALGTYDVSVPSRDVHGSYEECEATLDGRLIELQQDAFETPYVVPEGDNALYYTARLALNRGLSFAPVEQTISALMTTRNYVFGLGAEGDDSGTVLSAYNDVSMGTLGFRAATTDPYGRIEMRYPIDYDGAPVWTFAEGENATFLSDATDERDTTGVCNVVVCVYEYDDATIIGTAEDTDPASPWSIGAYGRRKVAVYDYNEAPQGTTDAQRQAAADARAQQMLDENRSIVRRVTIRHTYCPARVGDIVEVIYPSAGIFGKFAVRTQSVEVGSAGCLTTSELRRFERA